MTTYNDQISHYISSLFAEEDAPLQLAREESPQLGLPAISIKPEEGRFLQFLVRACGARQAVEIGTLGGYSGIWIAQVQQTVVKRCARHRPQVTGNEAAGVAVVQIGVNLVAAVVVRFDHIDAASQRTVILFEQYEFFFACVQTGGEPIVMGDVEDATHITTLVGTQGRGGRRRAVA